MLHYRLSTEDPLIDRNTMNICSLFCNDQDMDHFSSYRDDENDEDEEDEVYSVYSCSSDGAADVDVRIQSFDFRLVFRQ